MPHFHRKPVSNSETASEPLQILLVEDNPPDVYLLKLAIGRANSNCKFHVAATGEDAFRFLQREGKYAGVAIPDVIVLDFNLPLKNGAEVLALIRGSEQLRNIPVVLCSSSPREFHKSSALSPDACLTKPSNLDAYLAMGKEILACCRRKNVR